MPACYNINCQATTRVNDLNACRQLYNVYHQSSALGTSKQSKYLRDLYNDAQCDNYGLPQIK